MFAGLSRCHHTIGPSYLLILALLLVGLRIQKQRLVLGARDIASYGRIVPFFYSFLTPCPEESKLGITLTPNYQFQMTIDLSHAYFISYFTALKPIGNGSKHSSAPFLGHPRGRLPLLIIVNLLAGDIQLNPGPTTRRGRKPKYPCGLCSRAVKDSGIQCSTCENRFHFSCSDISNTSIDFHTDHPEAAWLCPTCDMCNLANLTFADSPPNMHNSFEKLSSINENGDAIHQQVPLPANTKRCNPSGTVPMLTLRKSDDGWEVVKKSKDRSRIPPANLKKEDG